MKNNQRLTAILFLSFIGFLMAMLFLVSCSCESKLSRIKKNCPDLLKKDTLTIKDTFFTKEVHRDTIFKFHSTSDTVTLKQDNLTIKYFYNTKDSTIYINGQCDTIRIIKEYQVPYDHIVYKETFWSFLKEYWYVFLIVIAIIIFVNFIKK